MDYLSFCVFASDELIYMFTKIVILSRTSSSTEIKIYSCCSNVVLHKLDIEEGVQVVVDVEPDGHEVRGDIFLLCV